MAHTTGFIAGNPQSDYVSAQARLEEQARRFLDDYPDLHGLAWAAARQLLHELAGSQADPGKVWWHRFGSAASSARSFTGWEHSGAPLESMTLVELMLQRFSLHDQQAADELQVYGGFYLDGPEHGHFDERNEVRLLPQQVMARLWTLDLATQFGHRVEAFWSVHAATFVTLARSGFTAAAALALRNGVLGLADWQALEAALAQGANLAPGGAASRRNGFTLHSFDIGGYESSRILRAVDGRGRQILYVAGEAQAIRVFATERELLLWVRGQLLGESSRQRFMALFLQAPQLSAEQVQAFDALLRRIRDSPLDEQTNRLAGSAVGALINQADRLIAGDVFEHWAELAQRQMQGVAQALMSNGNLRKQLWIGHLNTLLQVFGPLSVLSWPLALSLVGAGLVGVGLNIEQAINGRDTRQRRAGVIGAVFNAIYVLFNLPLLVDTLPALRLGASGESSGAAVANEGAEQQAFGAGGEDIPMQGIAHSASGETWIVLDGVPRRVRFSSTLNTWLAVDPLAPFAFEGAVPVRLDAQGRWQVLPALKLSGGMQAAQPGPSAAVGLPRVSSEFWDIHMRFNAEEEDRLSDLALERQKAVLDLHEAEPHDEINVDTEGDQVLVDAWGNEYRVFRTPQGRYVGGRLNRYSEREEEFNQYLRTGKPRISHQVEMIEDLADDLRCVGYDNHATLYRGGSGARGTSGLNFRQGHIKAGDVLVNTDFTSFSENPYVARSFASSQAGAPSYGYDGPVTFDDTSIVFEMPAGQYLHATPMAPFSQEEEEAELLFAPGHYFRVCDLHEVAGEHYRFVRVRMQEIPAPQAGERLFEMRTGEPFSLEQYAARLGPDGQRLVERFFAQAAGPAQEGPR